jgi:DNA repair exonuclease SbcCD ATPase subunit
MFKINNLTMRNFMSIGNVTQAVSFDNQQLTLVLGENLDLGGDDAGARNGVGKTTILNGLSYALYGTALTRIKKDNLINKSNGKNMMVTVEFERNGQIYHIERGRRKNVLRFYCGDDELSVDDEAQGDSRETQKTVEAAFGMSHDMFKHIVALNTYTEPFLSLNNANQRAIIEQLLGITLLSEKAENLKEINRETKRVITAIEARITADIDANKRIQKQIDNLERRQRLWKQTNTKEADEIREAIETLNELDVDGEIMLHADLAKWNQNEAESAQYETIIDDKARLIKQQERVLKNLVSDLETLADKKCHTCGQAFHGDQHEKTVATKEKLQTKTEQLLEDLNKEVVDAEAASLSLEDLGGKPETTPLSTWKSNLEIRLLKLIHTLNKSTA